MRVLDQGWKTIFKNESNQDISIAFIDCANEQITSILEKALIGSSMYARIRWGSPERLIYNKGIVSCLEAQLSLTYGSLFIEIKWHSQSGRIYDIADTDIDCNDIVFELGRLDVAKMNHYIKPKWSLFTFPESTIKCFMDHNKLAISLPFIKCADEQLSKQFEARTGIKLNRNVCISIPTYDYQFLYEKKTVSKLSIDLVVNANGNNIFICWKSKSGRIYDTADEDILCNDIEFWFDDSFDALLYHKQMYPKVELPFKLKNLPFEVKIERLNIDCIITMTLREGKLDQADEAVQKIDKCIDDFSMRAERRGEDPVHNWKTVIENNTIVCDMDAGFAGPEILKALFKLFTKMDIFSKVVVE